MHWKVFYIVAFLSQYRLSYEIEEDEMEMPYELLPSLEEYDEDISPFSEPSESDHDVIKLEELSNDVDSKEKSSEAGVSFAGPVEAKGTVSVAASFGYNAPGSYSSFYSMSPFWFPPAFFPQYFFPTSTFSPSPIPFTFSPIPIVSTFLPGIDGSPILKNSPENVPKDQIEKKPDSKEIFLEITPLKKLEEILPGDSDLVDPSVESLSSDEILASPVAFSNEDFTDYDAEKTVNEIPASDDVKLKEPESSVDGIAFHGFVPARGTVKIAARF